MSKKYHIITEGIDQFCILPAELFNLKLRALKYKMLDESIIREWYQKSHETFHAHSNHLIVGLNN